jgi:MYXO-CTERM domain-containing protein
VSPTIDPMAVVDPADLGCADDMPVVAVPTGARDACGTAVCAVLPDDDGLCPDGQVDDGGCCFAPPALTAAEATVTATPWRSTRNLEPVELRSAGAITGESSEFLWFDALIDPFAGGAAAPVRSSTVATLLGNGALDGCGAEASFSVHETRVALAPAASMADTRVELIVTGFDEGLRVEVDGRAVAYLSRRDLDEASGAITVPLFGQAAPSAGGARVVRLVHLGDCGAARPLLVRLEVVGHDPVPVHDPGNPDDPGDPDPDDGGDPAGGCGCRTSGAGGQGAVLTLAVLALALRRRRR